MLYGRFTFTSELDDEAILPPFKGSTFRGAFGTALKRVACALKRQECRSCLLAGRCVYPMFFEEKNSSPPKLQKMASIPQPFVIEPPLTTRTNFQSGEEFNFNLILFGPAVDYLPYCIYAFEQMGRIGIGKHVNGKRAGFVLKSVSSPFSPSGREAMVYSAEDQRILKGDFTSRLILQEPPASISRLTMHLKTPLRLKHENHFKDHLPFHILIRAALRRISSLFSGYGDGEPALDYKGLVERAKGVGIEEADIKWLDWERYSNRQEAKMFMGGMVGKVSYRGNLGEFLPLLQICEEVHVGKQTTFGLGQIAVDAP